MRPKSLFIFIEGDDDERFFGSVIRPKFERHYDSVKLIKYACQKPTSINRMIKSVKSMGADYILSSDINGSPCITKKINQIQRKFRAVTKERIAIVVREIESWYLAGLDPKQCKLLGIPALGSRESITKEKFEHLIPRRFDSKVDFMLEILKRYSISIAQDNNISIKHFIKSFDIGE